MVGFFEDSFYKIKEEQVKEGLHISKKYVIDKSKSYQCDIQPITEKSIKYTWGNEIKSKLGMYSEENLFVNDLLVNENKIYKIESKKDWKEYKIYALLEADIELKD